MPSITYKLIEQAAYLVDEMSQGNFKKTALGITEDASKVKAAPTAPLSLRKRFLTSTIYVGENPCYVVKPSSGGPKGKTHAILLIHGGGGMAPPQELHYLLAARLVERTGAELWFCRYPLAPAHNVLEALAWLEELWSQMVERLDPNTIAFVGDSAGANLSLSLCSRLMAQKTACPSAVVAISPAPGIANEHYEQQRLEIAHEDPIIHIDVTMMITKYWGRNADLTSPDIDPLAIDYTNFPRVLLSYGTHEIFCCAMPELINKMQDGGVEIEVLREKGLCHDYPLAWFLPEGRKAQQKIINFLNGCRTETS